MLWYLSIAWAAQYLRSDRAKDDEKQNVHLVELMNTDTGKDRVLKVLQCGEWIRTSLLAERAALQDNTTIKYVKFLRDEGHSIKGRKVDGKEYNEYRLLAGAIVRRNGRMAPHPCPKCGKFWRIDDHCSNCGELAPVPEEYYV
jgi:hypothetical protein